MVVVVVEVVVDVVLRINWFIVGIGKFGVVVARTNKGHDIRVPQSLHGVEFAEEFSFVFFRPNIPRGKHKKRKNNSQS